MIWHAQVPWILAWRLLRDRLPTKLHLLNRDILSPEDISCSAGCTHVESIQHLFIHCDIYGSIWQQVRAWIGVLGVDHQSLNAHFIQFTNYLRGLRTRRSFLQLLWLLCVWLVWKERNNRIFNNVHTPVIELIDKVRFHSYWWLKANNATFVYGSQQLWLDPLLCLYID